MKISGCALNRKCAAPVPNYAATIVMFAILVTFFMYLIMIYPSERKSILTDVNSSTIAIRDFSFSPNYLEVKAGTSVTWMNYDNTVHKISGGTFSSDNIQPGTTYTYKFDNPGTYDYSCAIHPYMKGRIVVT